MKRGLVFIMVLLLGFALPSYGASEEINEVIKKHFEPFGISLKASEALLQKEQLVLWLERYEAYRGFPLHLEKKVLEKEGLNTEGILKALGLKKDALFLPQNFPLKAPLTEKEALFLLRRIDTYYGYPDLIVYGSEIESISAALSAKKEGLETILLYEKEALGGLSIAGGLNYIDIPQCGGTWLLQGFAKDFHRHLGNGYDFEKANKWLKDRLSEANVLTKKVHKIENATKEKGKVTSLLVDKKIYYPKVLIDASENGDLFDFVGVAYSKGLYETEERYPAASLLYSLEGVDYKKVSAFLNERAKKEGTFEGAINRTSWGYAKEMKGYKPIDKTNAVRGLNIAYLKEKDKVIINHLFHTGMNPLDGASKKKTIESLKKETINLIPYLNKHLKGFEKARLSGFARELYLRDSRHFKGSYQYRVEDIVNRTTFKDRVLITNYPIDIHATKERKENLILYYPQSYEIPYRVMHDEINKNFLVTSKCASYTPMAAGSTRIVMMSEIGGLAASQAIKEAKPVQKIDITLLQARLKERGFIGVHPNPLKRKLDKKALLALNEGKPYDEYIKETVSLSHFFI